jgi:hypothetical protein
VKHPKRFECVVGMLAGPLSFRSISGAMKIMKACDAVSFPSSTATPSEVSDLARQIGGIYLVSLSSLLRAADGYAVARDGRDDGTGIKFFDVRVRVLVDGIIANLHVCVLPETVSATGESMFEMLDSFMLALDLNWRTSAVGSSTGGASDMTGWCAGLASRVVDGVSSTCYRVWCMAHQFSLVVKASGAHLAKPPLLRQQKCQGSTLSTISLPWPAFSAANLRSRRRWE